MPKRELKHELKFLIDELMAENHERHKQMNATDDQYFHTCLVNRYNNTLDIVKKLRLILDKQ